MKKSRFMPILLGLGLIASAGWLVVVLEPEPVEHVAEVQVAPLVTVMAIKPQTYQPTVTLLGTSKARWPVEVKANASAKLVWLDESLEPGVLVKQGDTLAILDTTHLKSQLAKANSVVKQATLNLQREQHEQTVALRMLSKKNSSAYARREPQIASAKAELLQAKEAYVSAKQHLKDATLVAPFDAVILHRMVSPGQQVEAGDSLFRLASSASLDVQVPIPEHQWNAIIKVLAQPKIQVIDRQQQRHPAAVRYVAPQVDSDSRQRQVVLSVVEPYRATPRLLPNQQLTVELTMAERDSVMQIPLSALTRDAQVWTVDEHDKLREERILMIEEGSDFAYVVFDNKPNLERRVVRYPLPSMISGTLVTPEVTINGAEEVEVTE